MIIDFRVYTDETPIGQQFILIKNKFYHQQPAIDDIIELKNLFQTYEPDNAINKYLCSLQSLIYLLFHFYKNTDYSMPIVDKILSTIEEEGLTSQGVWVDDKEGITILHAYARGSGDSSHHLIKTASIFAEFYAPLLEHQDKYGFTPLNAACKSDNIETALTLIKQGELDLSLESFQVQLTRPNNEGYTPVNSAVKSPDILTCLLEKIDGKKRLMHINTPNRQGYTPLHNACRHGHTASANILLEQGANIFINNNEGISPLISASWQGRTDIIELMADKIKAHPLAAFYVLTQTKHGDNALHKACYDNRHDAVHALLKLSTDLGEDVLYCLLTQQDKFKKTALDMAFKYKNYKALDSILSYATQNAHFASELIQHTYNIFWGRDKKALTILLYQGKENLTESVFKKWINQTQRGIKLIDAWKHKDPELSSRIQRYTQEKLNITQKEESLKPAQSGSSSLNWRSAFFRPPISSSAENNDHTNKKNQWGPK